VKSSKTTTISALLATVLIGFAAAATEKPGTDLALPWGSDPAARPAYVRAAAIAALGRRMFVDTRLSPSGSMSCASCHDPANHFAPANALSVQRGGPKFDQSGTRAAPALTYTATTPFFTEHYYESEDEGDESLDQGPTGGRTWDGRVNRARDQARIPLLAQNEMANESEASLVGRVARAPYAPQFKQLYGDEIFSDTHRAFVLIEEALEAYQQTPAEFSPFTSKYDAFLRGQVKLTPQEARGLAAFNDPVKGNCFHCHRSQLSPSGALPMFTDYGLIALGVPRNPKIPANADPEYFDLGACGPQRKDLANRPEFCGLFKAPSLRNVATRGSFYHNGVFHTLQDAVAFYATRDTNPERWYPVDQNGKALKFDDLPAQYRSNINSEPPLDRRPGQPPALSDQDVSDIVAFLRTLTDGYTTVSTGGGDQGREVSARRAAR
jgi:cytochrome c peroxidase